MTVGSRTCAFLEGRSRRSLLLTSLGLVTCDGASATVEELLAKADALAYRTKRAGKNRTEQDEKAGPFGHGPPRLPVSG